MSHDPRIEDAQTALRAQHDTRLAAAGAIHWWDRNLLRELLILAACPVVCVGYRQPDGPDWHQWCEQKADAALAVISSVQPPTVDPLRVLLADEAKLVDIAAEALYYVRPILHGDGSWAWVSEASKNHYQEMVRPSVLAVLAALRKEAGL